MYQKAIHWFRRDLRISDNTALAEAARQAKQVIPAYIRSTWKEDHLWTGPNRQSFLCSCLESLRGNLESIDGRLIVREGDALPELRTLITETGAEALFFNRDPDPFGKECEGKLKALCDELGIACHDYKDVVLHEEDEVLKDDGDPYRVFTPYFKRWSREDHPRPVAKPKTLATPSGIKSLPVPTLDSWGLSGPAGGIVEGGERAARQRLKRALKNRIPRYKNDRDRPGAEGTSRLSQDLRYGTLSIRTILAEVNKLAGQDAGGSQDSLRTYISELAWREFYMQILAHFPEVLELEFNPDYRGLAWDSPDEKFETWKDGRTGFPFVDAGMRELRETGFMHNRVRMVVAMFLTKDLHYDWRLGEQFFMQELVDGEIASNNGGWQWSAGCGADAAPYFRIQNPWTQGKRHDPDGDYIKQWVPELADVPAKKLHAPPEDDTAIAADYPLPIVDHSAERERTLKIFKDHLAQKR